MSSARVRVLGLSGSLRRESRNRQLIRAARSLLPAEAALVTFDGLGMIPAFNEDAETNPPGSVVELEQAIRSTDAVLIATPEYNASLSGVLKNALDWMSRPYATNPLRFKPVAVVGASTGMFGAVWAQADTRRVLGAIGARVLETGLAVAEADHAFTADGALRDPELQRAYC
jgi:chromate reductase